jgi:hypothetical protein
MDKILDYREDYPQAWSQATRAPGTVRVAPP